MPHSTLLSACVGPADDGRTLLHWLVARFPYGDAAMWSMAIAVGRVTCNGKPLPAEHRIATGDRIACAAAADAELDVPILHLDDDCVVVAKPPGAVVDLASLHAGRTFVRRLATRLGDAQLHALHRLDRDTSGALLLARSAAAAAALQPQFATGAVAKAYLALVAGCPAQPQFVVDAPIGRAIGSAVRSRRVAGPGSGPAKAAVTRFTVLASTPAASLLRAEPRTGRTHQIRCHLELLGHPLLGDKVYGRRDDDYLADLASWQDGAEPWTARVGHPHHLLHAEALGFRDRRGVARTVLAPVPAGFRAAMAGLGLDARLGLDAGSGLDADLELPPRWGLTADGIPTE